MMSSKANKQVALQLIASVVVAGLIVIGIATLSGYLPTGTSNQTQQQQVQTYQYLTTTCGTSGCVNVIITTTTTTNNLGQTSSTTTATTSSTATGQISNFYIKGSPSASFTQIVMSNGPAILLVAFVAGVVLFVGVKRRRKSH
jgi:hypothetical protein